MYRFPIKDVCMCVDMYFYVCVHINIYIRWIQLCNYFKKVFLANAIIWGIKVFMTASKPV